MKPTQDQKTALAETTRAAYMRIQHDPNSEAHVLAFMDGMLHAMAEDPNDCHDHETVKFICELFAEACDRQTLSQ